MLFTKRTWLIAGWLSFPALALLMWWLSVQVYLRQIPLPRWDLPARGMICWGDNNLAGASPGDPPPERVSETPPGTLAGGRAALIARYVIDRHIGGQDLERSFFYSEGPTLVQATFPDGVRRLAWRRTELINKDALGMSGVAAAVYLDAATGEPLAVIRDVYVCEPSWSPLFLGADEKYLWLAWLQTSGQFLLLALYVAVVLFSLGIIAAIRRLRRRQPPPAASGGAP